MMNSDGSVVAHAALIISEMPSPVVSMSKRYGLWCVNTYSFFGNSLSSDLFMGDVSAQPLGMGAWFEYRDRVSGHGQSLVRRRGQ